MDAQPTRASAQAAIASSWVGLLINPARVALMVIRPTSISFFG